MASTSGSSSPTRRSGTRANSADDTSRDEGLVAPDMHYASITFTVRRGTRYAARMHLYRVHGVGEPL